MTPVDIERLFLPVVMHRIVFTPSFVATAREIGWTEAAAQLQASCVEIAPPPGVELEQAVGPVRNGRSLAAVAALCLAGTTAGATSANSVTMSVRQYVNANKVRVLAFSGQISSTAADELVTLLGTRVHGRRRPAARRGADDGRRRLASRDAVAAADVRGDRLGDVDPGALEGRGERAVPLPLGLIPYPLEFKKGVVTVRVNPSPLNLKLAGKKVALQRFSANTWQPYQQARLKYKPTLDARRRVQPRGGLQGEARAEAARARPDRERASVLPRWSVQAVQVLTPRPAR